MRVLMPESAVISNNAVLHFYDKKMVNIAFFRTKIDSACYKFV